MDMTFSAEEEAFRAEVRAWLEGAPVPDAEAPEGARRGCGAPGSRRLRPGIEGEQRPDPKGQSV